MGVSLDDVGKERKKKKIKAHIKDGTKSVLKTSIYAVTGHPVKAVKEAVKGIGKQVVRAGTDVAKDTAKEGVNTVKRQFQNDSMERG